MSKFEPLYQRALTIGEQQLGSKHPNTTQILDNLTRLQGKHEQAEPFVAIKEKQLGLDQNLTIQAQFYFLQDKYEQAEPLVQRALAITEKHLGSEHPDTAHVLEFYDIHVRNMEQKGKRQH